jgi:uncharacterized protein YejL (UPF0352 family)
MAVPEFPGRLHEDILITRAVFQRRYQQRIQTQPARQTEVAPFASHADDGRLDRSLDTRGDMRPHRFGYQLTVFQSQALVESAAESTLLQPLGAEKRAIQPRPGIGEVEHLLKQLLITVVSRHREPLHLVLIQVGVEAQQFRHASIEIAQRIRIILLLLHGHLRPARVPAGAAAEIAGAVQR